MNKLWTLGLVMGLIACSPSKQQFLERFEPAAIDAFCAPAEYFRQCFKVTEAECRELATRTLGVCIRAHESGIPDKPSARDGEQFGAKVGECAKTAYETELVRDGKRLDNARCNDASLWAK